MPGQEDEQQPGAENSPDDIEAIIELKVKTAMQDTEIRLGQKIETIAKEIGQSLQPLVDGAITAMLPNIVNQVGEQFESKLKERDNPGAAGMDNPDRQGPQGSLPSGVGRFLEKCTPKDILELVNAWKQPGSEQQLAGTFGTFLKGMSVGQKLKTGDISITDLEGAFGAGAQK